MQQLRSLLENSRSLTNEQFQGGHEHAGGTGKGGAASAFAADSLAMDVENIAATVSQNGPGADDLLSLPRIERPLDQLELQSRKLWQKTTRSRDGASEARAHYLLAGRGFDAERVAQTLNAIKVVQAFEPLQPLQDTDVEGYLRNEHELILVGCIEEARRDTVEAFESSFDKSLLLDWEQTKRSVFESLTQQQGVAVANANAEELQRSAYDRSSVSATGSLFPMRKSMLGTTTAAVGHAQPVSADHLQMYAQVVADINDVRLQERSVQVVSLFEDIARKQDSAAVSRSWELLAFVLGERVDGVRREAQNNGPSTPSTKGTLAATSRLYPTAKPIGGGAFRQREFAKTYLGAASGDKEAVALREHFIAGGRKWLESFFRQYLNDHVGRIVRAREQNAILQQTPDRVAQVDAHKVEATVAKMGVIQKIQVWSQQVLQLGTGQWELVDGYPFWAVIFYLIRSGCDKEALEYARHYERYLSKTEKRFLDYLASWVTSADHNIPSRLRADLVSEFNSRIRDGVLRPSASMGLKSSATAPTGLLSAMAPAPIDPYKYLVYRLMGRIGLDNTSIPAAVVKGLAGGILGWEDDLWFQLMLVREVAPGESSAPADRYTLNDLTNKYIGQFSVEQWTAGGQHPMRYFQILLLCGQFERAVQFLWTTAQQEVVALHFAIALAYYGVLRVPRELFAVEIDIGTYDERGQLCINFARMVQYTKSILVRAANPRQAAHYYFLLCLYADGYTGSSTTTGALSSSTSEAMKKLCHESIVDVLLETGQSDDFLGGLSVGGEDGARRYGFLDRYLPLIGITNQDEFKRCIIRPAAERAERRWVAASQRAEFIAGDAAGSSAAEDQLQENNAVLLYNLAEDYDTVLDILSRRMSDGLAQHGLQAAADQLLSAVKRATGRTRPGIYDHDIDHLSRLETMAASVLEYYSARPQILARVSADRKRTLMSLTALAGFFKSVLQLVQDVVRDGVDVIVDSNVAGGYMARVGSRANWTVALAIIEDLGLVPGGMGTAAGSGTGETTVDYARVATKAEQLRREFNDVVLRHLPDVVLGVETLLLIGWHEAANAGRGGAQSSRTGRDISLQSRQLLSFVSAVSRWYKIPAEVRRRLVTIDELMMH